ncbi:TonB-dependent siderophore receptor [Nostoc sp. CHAB 5784]|uniref:TonB-dependent siderophore receptor n=1 Tax=Nostoc mirabile TaxID=2907820 RepID=UPI001E3C6A21|nr:TonB-dependent siderophore receptor [Nostoc mirabile]MCC5667834.1 TonB-dependent siderophore receptor [Nostoc mirabile CHAB5784]
MTWNYWQPSIGVANVVTLVALQPAWAAPIPVTGVQLNSNNQGLEIVLQTPTTEFLNTITTSEGKTLIITVANTQLKLTQGQSFLQQNPTPDIAEVAVIQLDSNTVEIRVIGNAAPPTANIQQSNQGLVFNLTPSITAQNPSPPTDQTSEAQEPEEPIEITVIGESPRPTYQVPNSSVGTRTDTPIIDVPQAIQIIPREVIKDQGTRTVGEILKNTSSVNTGRSSSQAPALNPVIRGFESKNILRNGLRDETLRFNSDISNVERLELLKGPASVLFGRGDLGGVINLVTKQPLDRPFYSVEYQVGSFGLQRPSLDFSGPLGTDGVAYRLNSSYERADSFKQFENNETFFISPSVRLISNKDTTLIVDLEYLKYRSFETAPELPASGTVISNPNGKVALDANLGEPSLSESEANITRLGYRLDQRLNSNWSIKNEFLASFLDVSENTGVIARANSETADGLQPDQLSLNRFLVENPSELSTLTFNTSLAGKFQTGSIEHNLLFGVELARQRFKDRLNFNFLNPIDIFNPVYDPDTVIPLSLLGFDIDTNTDTQENTVGLYLQNQISLSKSIILVLGGRLDFAEQIYDDLVDPTQSFERNDTVFSPRVGLVIKPTENISLYASYSESFKPIAGRTRIFNEETGEFDIGDPFEPERGVQYEVGVKANLLGDRLSTTLAFYNLERSNIAAEGLDDPLSQFQIGKQRSRGIELDVAGEILPGWNLTASYAYTDTKILEDTDPEFVGKQLLNVPRNAFGLWTTYELQSGSLKGLGVGIGIFNQGERQGDLLNRFTLPSYWRTDASLFYRRDNFRAGINLQNLFDQDYFEGVRNIVRVIPGAPFAITGSVSWEF